MLPQKFLAQGANRIEIHYEGTYSHKYQIKCEANKILSLKLNVEKSEFSKENRGHAFEIEFLDEQNSKFTLSKSLRIVMNQKELDVKEAVGLNCPKLVYPNFGDYAYIKFELDQTTLENLKTSFTKIDDPFMRLMFSSTLWQMVRDQKFKISDYTEIALNAISSEQNLKVIGQLVSSISGGRRSDENCIYFYMPNESEVQRETQLIFEWKLLMRKF